MSLAIEQPTSPPIAAMPDLDPLETARAEILNLTALLDAERFASQQLTASNTRIGEERDSLREALSAMQENPLLLALSHCDAGAVLIEAGEELTSVARAVSTLRAAGSLTLTVGIAPMKGHDTALVCAAAVKTKLPKMDPEPAVFFTDEDGKLTRNDPRQREFAGPGWSRKAK